MEFAQNKICKETVLQFASNVTFFHIVNDFDECSEVINSI